MGFTRLFRDFARILIVLLISCISQIGHAWEHAARPGPAALPYCSVGSPCRNPQAHEYPLPAMAEPFSGTNDYQVKVAYGSTFGTSTYLDYATLELSKSVSRYPALTFCGPAIAEVQVALLASYVFYREGTIERLKRLDFHDGYELAWLPKGRFTFPSGVMGMSPYLESGAGLGYVSETYRNSGSRWNWSFLNGCGFEKCLPGQGKVSLGIQWRHMCNGNMWGEGDELHNSNSGTDMIQGLATFLQPF